MSKSPLDYLRHILDDAIIAFSSPPIKIISG